MQVRTLSPLSSVSSLGALPCGSSTTFVVSRNGTFAAPCTSIFLGKFQGLQRAVNAYVKKHGILDTISVDGDIGRLTIAAVRATHAHGLEKGLSGWPASAPQNIQDLAARVDEFTVALAGGASTTVSVAANPSTQNPSSPTTSDFKPATGAQKAGIGGGVLFAAAIAGLVVYKLAKKDDY